MKIPEVMPLVKSTGKFCFLDMSLRNFVNNKCACTLHNPDDCMESTQGKNFQMFTVQLLRCVACKNGFWIADSSFIMVPKKGVTFPSLSRHNAIQQNCIIQ